MTLIAEPLDEGLAERLESGKVKSDWDQRKVSRYMRRKTRQQALTRSNLLFPTVARSFLPKSIRMGFVVLAIYLGIR
jgi:hypothetical protein